MGSTPGGGQWTPAEPRSRVSLAVTCPLLVPPGTPRTPRSQQKNKVPLSPTQPSSACLPPSFVLLFLLSFLPSQGAATAPRAPLLLFLPLTSSPGITPLHFSTRARFGLCRNLESSQHSTTHLNLLLEDVDEVRQLVPWLGKPWSLRAGNPQESEGDSAGSGEQESSDLSLSTCCDSF